MATAEAEQTALRTPPPKLNTQFQGKQLTFRGPRLHEVGYRVFLLDAAYAFHIERFEVHNLTQDGEQTVVVRFGSDDPQSFSEYEAYIRSNHPDGAQVLSIENTNQPPRTIQSYERTALNLQTKQLYKGVGVIKQTSEMTHQKLDSVGGKIDGLGDKMDQGFENLGDKMDQGFENLGDKMDQGFESIGEKLDDLPERIAQAMNQNHQRS